MSVRSHVIVVVILTPSRRGLLPLFGLLLSGLFVECYALEIAISTGICHDATAAQIRRLRRPTQGGSIGSFASKHRRLVFFPVTLLEMEPPILCPKEEPDAREHKAGPNQCKQGEDASVID